MVLKHYIMAFSVSGSKIYIEKTPHIKPRRKTSRDLGKRFALDDRMVHIWKLGVATPDHHISHVIHLMRPPGDPTNGPPMARAKQVTPFCLCGKSLKYTLW
jgi:hypothetical protein